MPLLQNRHEQRLVVYDSERDDEIDFIAELAAHLAADSVAVILETGAEKLR